MTQELLKKHVSYNEITGIFTRIYATTPSNKKYVRKPTGNKSGRGYLQVKILGKKYLAHRLAFMYMIGRWPEPECDHKNRIPDDNRWENLREVTRKVNNNNRKNASGYKWSDEKKDNFTPSNKSELGTSKIYKKKKYFAVYKNEDGTGMKYKCQFRTKEEAKQYINGQCQ